MLLLIFVYKLFHVSEQLFEEAVTVGACSIEIQWFRRKCISQLLCGGVGQGNINANSGKQEEVCLLVQISDNPIVEKASSDAKEVSSSWFRQMGRCNIKL